MGLHVKASDVPWLAPKNTEVLTEELGIELAMVYGEKFDVMIARRQPGYHSTPHRHESEQVNYCIKGKMWSYIDDDVVLIEEGDFRRIPAWSTHWAWNRFDEECVMLEVHAPMSHIERHVPFAIGLFADGEEPRIEHAKPIEYTSADIAAVIEQKIDARG